MEELLKEARGIQEFTEITCSNEPEEIMERMFVLQSFMARSGEMWSTAKKLLRKRKTEQIQKIIIDVAKAAHLSASVQNALLDSICEDESNMVDWFERINRTCTHQIDCLRSQLSYIKEDRKQSNMGG